MANLLLAATLLIRVAIYGLNLFKLEFMASTKRYLFRLITSVLFLGLFFSGCSTSKSNYQKEYTRVWKEIIKSEAWKNSLATNNSEMHKEGLMYADSNSDGEIVENSDDSEAELRFEKRFHSMVSRAYFKIISEAEKADKRLTAEYDRWNLMHANEELKKDRKLKNEFELVTKKYHAHRKMLEGLKSWNIFSEFRSNDLDFFKAENKREIQKMYHNGKGEDQMINYLIFRLADLYHYEE